MLQPVPSSVDLCPECGEFVDYLNERTGWCNPCSGITPSTTCRRCNKQLDGFEHNLCSRCKYLAWLEVNANEIERVMAAENVTAARAKQLVKSKNRPICLSCNTPIKGGTKGRTFFCTKTAKCRKAINAYRYYKHKKNLPHEVALQRALERSTLFNLITQLTHRGSDSDE